MPSNALLVTAVAGNGAITGGELTIELTDVVDGVTGIDDVVAYVLADDAVTGGNTFTVAATDQAVAAGNQGDTLNANTGNDNYTLGDGVDTVVYTSAAQSYVVEDLGDTPAPNVVAGSDATAQVTTLTFTQTFKDNMTPQANDTTGGALDLTGYVVTITLNEGEANQQILDHTVLAADYVPRCFGWVAGRRWW